MQNIDVIKDSDVLNSLDRPVSLEIGEGELEIDQMSGNILMTSSRRMVGAMKSHAIIRSDDRGTAACPHHALESRWMPSSGAKSHGGRWHYSLAREPGLLGMRLLLKPPKLVPLTGKMETPDAAIFNCSRYPRSPKLNPCRREAIRAYPLL